MQISWLAMFALCVRLAGIRLLERVPKPSLRRSAHNRLVGTEKDRSAAPAHAGSIRSAPSRCSRAIAEGTPLRADASIAVAIPLGLSCPLDGCTGHLYEALTREGRRRLLCTDHRA